MAINDVYRVDYRMISDDRVVSVSAHYIEVVLADGNNGEVTEAIALQAEIDFWTTFWAPLASGDLVYHDTIAQQIYPSRQAPFVSAVLAGDNGAVMQSAMNGTTAVLIAEYGVDWNRAFQGRMYLPGWPETEAESGRMAATALAAAQTAADIFFAADIIPGAPAGGGYAHAVVSPTRVKTSFDPVFSLIGATPVRPRIATQRRRRTNVLTAS